MSGEPDVKPIYVFIAGSDPKYFELTVQSIRFLKKNVPGAVAGVISSYGSGEMKIGIEDKLKELEPDLDIGEIHYVEGQKYFEDWGNAQHILDIQQFCEEFDPIVFLDSDSVVLRNITPYVDDFYSSGKKFAFLSDFLNDYNHFRENWEDKDKLFIPQPTFMLFRSSTLPDLIPLWKSVWEEWITPAPFVKHKNPARFYRLSRLAIGQYALGQALYKTVTPKTFDKEITKIARSDLKMCRNLGVEVQKTKTKFLLAGSSFSNDGESHITINVKSGEIYENQDTLGNKGDPFVTVKVSDWERKTKVIKNTKEPVWNETFVYEDTDYNDADNVLFTVSDYDGVTKNDEIGTAKLSLIDIKTDEVGQELKSYTLPVVDKDGKEQGKLEIGAEFFVEQLQDEDDFAAKMVRAIASLGSSLGKLEPLKKNDAIIKVASAKIYKQHDPLSKDDPFVTVKIGNDEKKTRTKKNTQDPVFDEEFVFPEVSNEEADNVVISLWDQDSLTKNDLIGTGKLSLEDYRDNRELVEVPVRNKKGVEEAIVRVEALLQVRAEGYGLAPDQELPPETIQTRALKNDLAAAVKAPPAAAKYGQATFTVKDGKIVSSRDLIGKGDPYVKIVISEQEKRTSTKMSTKTPKWNEKLVFDDIPITDDLVAEISAWDEDKGSKDDFIGALVYPIGKNPLGKKKLEALELKGKKGKLEATINIEIDLK